MVFYRKYRPQTIKDLDSEKLQESLYAILSLKSIPHSFLFTGSKGLGKTSAARILAKAVNCLHADGKEQKAASSTPYASRVEPCNKCDQCVSITNGNNIDVLEIDGASNRGIDEIRDLRDKVNLAASIAKKKIYIIDEVHMLTAEAFNALLKTIEEPPAHVLFIFCTTELHKVPQTIVSRCFHISFLLATTSEIVHSLKRIVKGENIQTEDEALFSIAELSQGSFRDGAKILEEMVSLSNSKKITKEFIENKYQILNIKSSISIILKSLKGKNAKAALVEVEKIVQQGTDVKYFLTQILETLYQLLLKVSGVIPTLENDTFVLSVREIKELIEIFSEAFTETKAAVIAQLPLEIAIVVYVINSTEHRAQSIELRDKPYAQLLADNKTTITTLLKKQRALEIEKVLRGEDAVEKKEVIQSLSRQKDLGSQTFGDTNLFENIIYKMKQINHSIAGVLRGCSLLKVTDEEIIFGTKYKFHKERLEEVKTCAIIEKVVKEITGKSLKAIVQLANS